MIKTRKRSAGRPRVLDAELSMHIGIAHHAGMSWEAIGEAIGVSPSTLRRLFNDGLDSPLGQCLASRVSDLQ
jgi:hypothetical protein